MTIGPHTKSSVLCEPIKDVKYPLMNMPGSAAKQSIEPAQDISSFVNGPDSSGVSSDVNIGKAVDSQPIANPVQIEIKFARGKMAVCIKLNLRQ